MTAIELEFKDFLERLMSMLEITLKMNWNQPDMISANITYTIELIKKKLKELT